MYSKHHRAIERMYTDRATIRRYVETTASSGETKLSEEPEPIYVDQPCRISQMMLGKNAQSEAQNVTLYEMKLFIAPEIVIKQGDEIDVTRGSVVYHCQAGEPFSYSTHQEVSLQRRGYA